jgi:methylenetetrahydrofolate dehydrogenase (NADP+)/methenyltetrahydrofolate cyclohydrolase
MELIDGKKISAEMKREIATEVQQWTEKGHPAPHLTAVIVGNDGASETYVASKAKSCAEVGIRSTTLRFPASIGETELLAEIEKLNNDGDVDGFIVQLPLPAHISDDRITMAIRPEKDVDGFHPQNLGRLILGLPCYLPATPMGILEMIRRTGIETKGKHCVVLGRSHIVGTPVALLMSRKAYPGNATVTICHSHTIGLKEICRSADILIVALGQQEFVTGDMVKDGATVIDVGIHRIPSKQTKSGFRIVGDVLFDEVASHCSYISPVPGGVGLLTIVSLLKNTLLAAKKEVYS